MLLPVIFVILWSAHGEEELHKWFSSNFNVEVHAFLQSGKYCVKAELREFMA